MRITGERPLVLGSASPRRRELLALAAIPLEVRPADADESRRPGETVQAYVGRVVRAKMEAVRLFGIATERAVLTADTAVALDDGIILGKPGDLGEAVSMIERLAGTTHTVQTCFALALGDRGAPIAHMETVITQVRMRPLALGEAEAYAATGEGRDKAGGYAIQGMAAAFVQRIEGSYTNVVGLPLCEVVSALRALGWLQTP